jgi:hypothetical protein
MYRISRQTKTKIAPVVEKTEYTPEKIKDLLKNYLKVPKTEWNNIPCSSHIRYIRKDGRFVPGGFVHNVNAAREEIWMSNKPSASIPGYKKWATKMADIKSIYKKIDEHTKLKLKVEVAEMGARASS